MNTGKITVAMVMAMLLAFMTPALNSNAQQMHGMMGRNGMMGCGMMGNMMGNGMMNRGMMNWTTNGDPDLYLQFSDELNLSSGQIEDLKQIRMDFTKNTSDNRSELQVANLELQDLLEMENIDLGNVEEKINNIHEIQAEIQLEAIKDGIRAKNVLTPVQREQARNLHRQHDIYDQQQQGKRGMGSHSGMMR